MTANELIGQVAAHYLRDRLTDDDPTAVARYVLDCLTAEQTAAVARAVLGDTTLLDRVEIRLPISFVGSLGLPDAILTKERTTYFRNAACAKSALLVANTGDDEEQSLKELVPIGAPQLQGHPGFWVDCVAVGLPVNAQHREWWGRSLTALLQVKSLTLEHFAQYVLETRKAVDDGHPILLALGFALPALRAPRDSTLFSNMNQKTVGSLSQWKALFGHVIGKRACYLLKQTPSQNLLSAEDLSLAFVKVRDSLPVETHGAIEAFIEVASGWNKEAAALSKHEWDMIRPLFDGLKKENANLGKLTSDFYSERDPELLSEDERGYLLRLTQSNRKGAQEEDEEFYRRHRGELKEQASLKAKWDRFIFGVPLASHDFLMGIALCLEHLFDQNLPTSKRRMRIACDSRTKRDLKDLNEDAGLYFARRYRGLRELLGSRVTWDVGELFDFESLTAMWRSASKPHVNKSVARAAVQLKFRLELQVQLSNGDTEVFFRQFTWIYEPNSIASEFAGDLGRLLRHPLVHGVVNREPVSGKGRFQSLDLQNVRTLYPAHGQDRGSLVSDYRAENDIDITWPANLSDARRQGLISEKVEACLSGLFGVFKKSYCDALDGWVREGISCVLLAKQAKDFGVLLNAICVNARGDRNREMLLRPLLRIGTVCVEGGRPSAIVAPWHPLRMSAIANKASQVAGLVRHLLSAENIFFGDPALFFKEIEEELSHPYYPEVVLGWQGRKPEVLALTDSWLDYSLHETPVIGNEELDETNESPAETSLLIVELTKRFLALFPHERANLSVVLYNCDSARLPYALVDKFNELQEDEEDMRCQVILRHRDAAKLRDVYERLIESTEADVDSFVSSEASKDFMARLRIGIMADQAPVPDVKDGPPADLVFLKDVISRHAGLEWYLERAEPVDSVSLVPPRWSRRRPSPVDEMKSVVYLCCPVQSEEGWSYTTALTTFIRGDWDGMTDRRLLPARKLDFGDPQTAAIFKEIHNLGNWVVNYDDLLDRRQLLNQNVRVIRCKQGSTQGRNLLISSTAPLGLLASMVLARIKDLNLGLPDSECQALAQKFITDASDISGDIVLRAAKRGRNASELMGVVLSRYIIRQELGTARRYGWYFLDDYAGWLGQREEQIADILVLSPEQSSAGTLRLSVVLSEAKYIDYGVLANKRKESQKQLRDTFLRVRDALFGDPMRLDRDLWLSRFSDLLVNGIQYPANSPVDLVAWRRAVREGECEIYLRGYSHIFVSGPSDSPECSECVRVAGTEESWQEVFSRAKLREVVLGYWKDTSPMALRKAISHEDVWPEPVYRKPAERIRLVVPADGGEGLQDQVGGFSPTPPIIPPPVGPDFFPVEAEPPLPSVQTEQSHATPEGSPVARHGVYPGLDRLIEGYQGGTRDSAADQEWVKDVGNRCKGALQQFQLNSKLLRSMLTPNAALLTFQGSSNLTVDQVLKRRSEFLTTHGLGIVSVKAEPGAIAIAIARPARRVLHLLEVWKDWNPVTDHGNVDLPIGVKEADGAILFLSPRRNAPHTLIGGSTGSGKSVLMQNILLAIAASNRPEEARIILIDPKLGVDYFGFEGLPHLQGTIIDKQDDAIHVLEDLVTEMDRRYEVLRFNRVANIFDLAAKDVPSERLPCMWVIHDEFAEWMLTPKYSAAVSDLVARLGVKARAAGIFLVFASQRPDATVMPMQLRANLGNRLVLRVDGEGTSEIALGEKGAERLLGKGHMATRIEGQDGIVTAQVPFVGLDELVEMVRMMRQP